MKSVVDPQRGAAAAAGERVEGEMRLITFSWRTVKHSSSRLVATTVLTQPVKPTTRTKVKKEWFYEKIMGVEFLFTLQV